MGRGPEFGGYSNRGQVAGKAEEEAGFLFRLNPNVHRELKDLCEPSDKLFLIALDMFCIWTGRSKTFSGRVGIFASSLC